MQTSQHAHGAATHLYRIGQAVECQPVLGTKPLGTCKITALLPPLGEQLQYRIRSEHEAFERVVVEHQLRAH